MGKKIDVTDACHARLKDLRRERRVFIKDWASEVLILVIDELDRIEASTPEILLRLARRGVFPVPRKKLVAYDED